MKRLAILAATVAAFGLVNAAQAADMPAKAPAYKAPVAVATPWTGFYVNGGIGYGMWAADTTVETAAGVCTSCATQVQGGKGWMGTLGVGYDYQFTDHIVAGVLGDGSLSSLEGTIQDGQPFRAGQLKETSSWSAGVRAGWLVTPRTLSYFNGGYTGARFSSAAMVNAASGASTGLTTPETTFSGWFFGGGIESLVAPNLFWRTEFRSSYYSSKDLPEQTAAGATSAVITFKPTVQTVTTQLVYKFNGGLPAPAYAPVPVRQVNWTGVYVNAGIGYGLWAGQENSVSPATGLCTVCVTQTQGGKGWLGTIGAGYDWQFAPMWVAGVFADADWSSLKGTLQDRATGQPQALEGDIKQTSAWAVGPRVGWLVNPQTLTYVNAGFTSAQFSGATMLSVLGGAPTGTTQSFTTNGWFAGGGVETSFDLLGMLPKGFFFRSEYRYASYENKTLADTGAVAEASINFKPVVQTIKSSVIYKLN